MVRRVVLFVAVILVLQSTVLRADPPVPAAIAPSKGAAPAPGDSAHSLSLALRPLVIQAIPKPLYEASPGWGKTREGFHGLQWTKGRVLPRAEVVKSPHNDGVWRKIRINAQNLDKTLAFEIRNFNPANADRLTFSVLLAFDTDIEFEQQNWEKGLRLYAGSLRARARARVALDCEAQMRLETGKSLLPEAVFRLRVLKADVGYDNLVVEHIGGVGGTTAKVIGDTFHRAMTKRRPELEKNLLERTNAAIVRAGDTREVRVSLNSLLKAFDKKKAN